VEPGQSVGAPLGTLRAVLVTDVVDSVQATAGLDDVDAAELWRRHHRVARDLVRSWQGREIDSSDGFLLVFEDVAHALGFAGAYHDAIARLQPPLKARAGLHVGAVQTRDNSPDDVRHGAKPVELEGVAKVIAARTMSAAPGGATFLTAPARDLCADLRRGIESRGFWRLKGIDAPVELFEVVADRGAAAIAVDTPKAYRVVRSGDVWLPVREIRHTLPAERGAFVGRGAALAELRSRIDRGARLLSLLGPGGVGKTRLAQRFAWMSLGEFAGGVWFCDLSQAQSLDGIFYAVSQGLQMTLGPADAATQVGDALAGREEFLLILDNFEQLVAHAEPTVGRWLERAPRGRFLVTSRESLGIAGEEVMRLGTMAGAEARSLFVERASAAGRDPVQAPADAAVTDRLVELLEGLPLAIELAAAHAGSMPLPLLLRRLGERFSILVSKSGRRSRQGTLRAAFDWSWDSLDENAQATLARLSVVEGSCSLEAAEAIAGEGGRADATVFDTLQSLVDKSLIRLRDDDRYDMLASLRQYAAEKLAAQDAARPGAREAARLRHCSWFARLDEAAAVAGRGVELDNLIQACAHAVAIGETDLAVGALERAWTVLDRRGPFRVAIDLADKVLGLPGLDDAARARAEFVRGYAMRSAGDPLGAENSLQKALALARAQGIARTERRALAQLGDLYLVAGRIDAARETLDEALALARAHDDLEVEGIALGHLGNLAENSGDMDEAFACYGKTLEIARRRGDRRREGGALGNLGLVLHFQGKFEEARERYGEALRLARDVGDRQWEGNTLCNLGLLLHQQGAMGEARAALEASLSVATEMGYARLAAVVHCNLGIVLEATLLREAAARQYQQAIAIAKSLADRRSEGQFLGYLGLARARQGRFEEARQCFENGQRLLDSVGDRGNGAALLCQWTEAEQLAGNPREARERLAQARALASTTSAGDQSELAAFLRQAAEVTGDFEAIGN
jgi:predicted ATPase/class 3 adenylate cyclase/Tfp pilus assembly protein PilF